MKPLSQLVRPNIQALQPYSTARDEYAGGGIDVWLCLLYTSPSPRD